MDAIFNPIAMPFGRLLMFLYELVNNYGLALILVAIAVKVILLPFQMKGKRGMMRQSRLQPKIAELQKKHAANKQKLNEEMAKLYKEEGVNPASGCLWSFIQMPIMIALFYAIRQPLTLMMGVAREYIEEGGLILTELASIPGANTVFDGFYAQVHIAQEVSRYWDHFKDLGIHGLRYIEFNVGIVDLAQQPQWQVWLFPWNDFNALLPMLILFALPLVSGGTQFINAHIMRKMNPTGSPEAAGGPAGNIIKFMPLMSVWFGFILPAALSLYWTIGTVLQIGQDVWLTKKYTKILDEEDAEKAIIRKAKEAEIEAKRLETERKKAEGIVEQNLNTSKRKKKKGAKQGKREKAAEWEKKNAPPRTDDKNEPGRVGTRRYARGRAYDPDRFGFIPDDDDSDFDDVSDDIEDDEVALEAEVVDDDSYDGDDDGFDEGDDSDEDSDDGFDEDDGSDDESDDDFDGEDDDDFDEDDDDESDTSSEKFETKRFD